MHAACRCALPHLLLGCAHAATPHASNACTLPGAQQAPANMCRTVCACIHGGAGLGCRTVLLSCAVGCTRARCSPSCRRTPLYTPHSPPHGYDLTPRRNQIGRHAAREGGLQSGDAHGACSFHPSSRRGTCMCALQNCIAASMTHVVGVHAACFGAWLHARHCCRSSRLPAYGT